MAIVTLLAPITERSGQGQDSGEMLRRGDDAQSAGVHAGIESAYVASDPAFLSKHRLHRGS